MNTRIAVLVLALSAVAPTLSLAQTSSDRAACEKPLNEEIKRINDQLRSGVSVSMSESLKKQLKDLDAKRRACRSY